MDAAPIPICPSCGVIAPTDHVRCTQCTAELPQPRPLAAGGADGGVFARVRLDATCGACGASTPVPLSLAENFQCSSCGQVQELRGAAWTSALDHAHAVADLCDARGPTGGNDPFAAVGRKRSFAEHRSAPLHVHASPGHPPCPRCRALLSMRRDPEGAWIASCAACGAQVPCDLPPRADVFAVSLVTVVRPPSRGDVAAMLCPNCGGALPVNASGENADMVACPYCQTSSRVQRRAVAEEAWALFRGPSFARREMEAKQAEKARKAQAPPARPKFDRWTEAERFSRQDDEERRESDSDTWRTVLVFLVVGAVALIAFVLYMVYGYAPSR